MSMNSGVNKSVAAHYALAHHFALELALHFITSVDSGLTASQGTLVQIKQIQINRLKGLFTIYTTLKVFC